MNYKLIEKVIDLIPSKDLKKSYKDDLSKGIYPEWTEEECLTIVNMSWHNINEEIDYFKQVVTLVSDVKIKESIDMWIKELIHRGTRQRLLKHPDFIEKYVKIKTLYKKGELVSRWWNNKKLYAVISRSDDGTNDEKLKDILRNLDGMYSLNDSTSIEIDFNPTRI